MGGSPTSRNLIAVIIGAVLLFGVISVTPIIIMRRHRRRAAERHASELHRLEVNGSMRQVTLQSWLDRQTTWDNLERYAGESCPICLTSLLARPALSPSGSTIHLPNHNQQPPPPPPPEAAHLSHQPTDICRLPTNNDDDCTRLPRGPSSPERALNTGGSSSFNSVLILTRCNHAFHTTCLASWFAYRQYRCPICSDVLFTE